MTTATLTVKSLPVGIRSALSAVGYTKPDISLRARNDVHIAGAGGAGIRAFAVLVHDVKDDRVSTFWGSWGGPNMFASSRTNPIDDMRAQPRKIEVGGAVVTGDKGDRCYAVVSVRPETFLTIAAAGNPKVAEILEVMRDAAAEERTDAVAKLLAEALEASKPADELDELQHRVLNVFWSYKGGARQKYLDEIAEGGPAYYQNPKPAAGEPAVKAALEHLIAQGYLKRSSNGATALTTKGKNARSAKRGW